MALTKEILTERTKRLPALSSSKFPAAMPKAGDFQVSLLETGYSKKLWEISI